MNNRKRKPSPAPQRTRPRGRSKAVVSKIRKVRGKQTLRTKKRTEVASPTSKARKRLADAVREHAERFRFIIDHANDAIFYLDLAGVIQWASLQATVLTGRPMSDLVGNSVASVLTPQATVVAEARLAAVRRGEAVPPLVELDFVRPDGRSAWVEANITSVYEKGKIIGRLLVARDVTERKRAAQALRESEERLAMAMTATDLGLWDWNIQTGSVVFGHRWASMLGYDPMDIEPNVSAWERMIHPDDIDHVNAVVDAHLEGRIPLYQTEHRLRTKSGEWRWVYDRGKVVVRDSQGKPLRMAGTYHDITERKRAEEALREQGQQLRLFTLATNDMFWDFDLISGSVVRSIGWERAFGYTQEEIIPNLVWWEERIHPEDRNRILDTYQGALAKGGSTYSFEYRFRRRDNSYAVIHDRAYIIRDHTGKAERIMGAMTDITERKLAEEEREKLYERLQASHAGLRTLSRRLMEVQEQERRHLASELHDEIGQALTAVKINLQQAMHMPASPEAGTHLDESVTILDRTLKQVRNLSLDLRPSLLDDLGLAPTLKWMADRHAQASGITITFSSDMENLRFPVDVELACYRTAQEALTNAIRHANATMIAIAMVCSDSELRLTVRDDGVGFDLSGTLTRAREGKSAGLLGILERVSLLGGQLDIQSRHGSGTQIHARFPLIAPHIPDAPHP